VRFEVLTAIIMLSNPQGAKAQDFDNNMNIRHVL
jgi:hypothetical protein